MVAKSTRTAEKMPSYCCENTIFVCFTELNKWEKSKQTDPNANPVNTEEASEWAFYIGCLCNGSNNYVNTSGHWIRDFKCVRDVSNPVSDFMVTFLSTAL